MVEKNSDWEKFFDDANFELFLGFVPEREISMIIPYQVYRDLKIVVLCDSFLFRGRIRQMRRRFFNNFFFWFWGEGTFKSNKDCNDDAVLKGTVLREEDGTYERQTNYSRYS